MCVVCFWIFLPLSYLSISFAPFLLRTNILFNYNPGRSFQCSTHKNIGKNAHNINARQQYFIFVNILSFIFDKNICLRDQKQNLFFIKILKSYNSLVFNEKKSIQIYIKNYVSLFQNIFFVPTEVSFIIFSLWRK